MWGAGVGGVVLACSPDFVEEESARLIGAGVKIESQAALFLSRGSDQRAEFGFEEHVLAFFGSKRDDKGDRMLRQFCDRGAFGAATRRSTRGFAGLLFRHVGGDCTPKGLNGKQNWKYGECSALAAREYATLTRGRSDCLKGGKGDRYGHKRENETDWPTSAGVAGH